MTRNTPTLKELLEAKETIEEARDRLTDKLWDFWAKVSQYKKGHPEVTQTAIAGALGYDKALVSRLLRAFRKFPNRPADAKTRAEFLNIRHGNESRKR